MKKTMKISTILSLVALLATSCSVSGELDKGKDEPLLPTDAVCIQLALPSTGTLQASKADDPNQGTAAENYIGVTQIVIFDPQNNDNLVRVINVGPDQTHIDQGTVWNPRLGTLYLRNMTGRYDVCVIANATQANGYDTSAVAKGSMNKSQLLEMITATTTLHTPSVGEGILMSGMANGDLVHGGKLVVDLTRQLVKIKLNVVIDQTFLSVFPELDFEDQALLADVQLNLYNAPSHSFVFGQTPVSSPLVSKPLDFHQIAFTKSGTGSTLKWEAVVYTYENPVSGNSLADRNESTFFSMRLPYADRQNEATIMQNYYKFYIKNPVNAGNPHQTLRNHFYELTATVAGFGGLSWDDGREALVGIVVVPWGEVRLPDSDRGYFFERTGTTFNGRPLTLTQGIGYIVDHDGGTLLLKYNSNVWISNNNCYYILRDASGDEVSRGPIERLEATDATQLIASVLVPSASTALDEMWVEEYTVDIYHDIYAPQIGGSGPIDRLKLLLSKGIILNEYLVKDFTANNVNYKGWPADKLPPRGLQVAKTGNVLPSGQALSVDPTAQWSTEYINTRVNALACGMGKGNTAELLKLGPAKYPAVNLCRALGSEWYLPSRDELLLIYANKGLLSSDYSFSANYYWTATQISDYYNGAWDVDFYNGSTSYYDKTDKYRVRCVRDI